MNFLETPKSFRIDSLDILRGTAIMGILLVNGPTLNGPATKDMVDFAFQNTSADLWYSQIIFLLAVGKFYPIFACLFGVTAAIFMNHGKKNNVPLLWCRRLIFLFLAGILHVIFVWWGDILVVYSLLGFFLLLFYREKNDAILKTLWLLTALILILSVISALFPINEQQLLANLDEQIYQQGTWSAITYQRIFDYFGVYLPGIFYKIDLHHVISFSVYYSELLLMFFLGFYLYRSGWLISINHDVELAKKTFLLMLALRLLTTLFAYSFVFAHEVLSFVIGIVQALFYASAILFLCHYRRCFRLLSFLLPVGRMSLSNYLFHTTTLSLLFYGYGVGLYGKIGPALQAPILFLLMCFSVVVSFIWLRYFNYGPIEWLWRSFVYKKFYPFRRRAYSVANDALNDAKNISRESD